MPNSYQVAFAKFEGSLRQFKDIVTDGILIGCVLDVNVAFSDALDVNVALLIHTHFGSFANVSLCLIGPVVSHRVVKAIQSDPKLQSESRKKKE